METNKERSFFNSSCRIIFILFTLAASALYAQQSKVACSSTGTKWIIKNPFEQKVFIENKGQFDGMDDLTGSDIRYTVDNLGTQIFFTSKGLTYQFRKAERINETEKEEKEDHSKAGEEERKIKTENIFTHMQWEGANPNVQLLVENEVADYYTYADKKTKDGTIIAHAYKKLIYKNIYPGIDVEYTFHEK